MYWVNGHKCDTVELDDRSFQYGDGCFTTVLTKQGELQCWPYHIERMIRCLERLDIPVPDWQKVKDWAEHAAFRDSVAGIKIHISRGRGGRGYSPTQVCSSNVTISAFVYPDNYKVLVKNGVSLGVCQQRLGLNPLLAGLKHNNRLEQVLLKAEMDQQGYVDGIAVDINGHVIETTMANLFWRRGSDWFTPNLEQAGVAGVMRRKVLERFTHQSIPLDIGHFTLKHALQSEEIFMTNAILEIAPVIAIADSQYLIGTETRRLQEHFKSC